MRFIFFALFAYTSIALGADAKIYCVINIDNELTEIPLYSQKIDVRWVSIKDLKKGNHLFLEGTENLNKVLLLESPRAELVNMCKKAVQANNPLQKYFIRLEKIKAYKNDLHCHGHDVIYQDEEKVGLVYEDKTEILNKNLKQYNFDTIIPFLMYRSKRLGKDGIRKVLSVFEEQNLSPLKSIASLHVHGFGGKFGNYNIEEFIECGKRNIEFLHSFHFDPRKTIFMDGTDPSHIDEKHPEHGNIFKKELFDRFIPDKKIQEALHVDEILESGRVNAGNTMDFLTSIENIIDAPWPILIHCKGGRHKTGMLAIIFSYLLDRIVMHPSLLKPIRVSRISNHLFNWLYRGESFTHVFSEKMYETIFLTYAEQSYYQHNSGIFRKENIEFVRNVINKKALTTLELKEKWETIQRKFYEKIEKF